MEKEEILQMEEEKKVCIIDNFEEIVVSDKLIKKILHIRYIFSQYFIAECGCLFEELSV